MIYRQFILPFKTHIAHCFKVDTLLNFEFVLLRRAISLKVIYEEVKFSNCVFAITLVIMDGHTCKLFENVINDVQNKGTGR